MVRCLIDPRCQEEDYFSQGISDDMFEAIFCQVVEPDQPTEPAKPEPSAGTLPQEQIDELVKQAENAAPQEVVIADMKEAVVVPAQLLRAAKGKNLTIQMNMGGYIWTIDGRDILTENPKDINMQVILNTRNIPSTTVRTLAGNSPVRQLSLVHEGDFGFKAVLTIDIGKEYAGLYGNLYYYDSAGKMVFIDAGRISAEGAVSLTFSHASDYLIVMSAERLNKNQAGGTQMPNQKNVTGNVAAGDTSHVSFWMVSSLAALGVMVLLTQKQYRKKRH